jgi:hypothetical protein
MKLHLSTVLLAYLVIAGCLSPRPWWEKELNAWVGAEAQELESTWGPPTRTIIGDSGRPVLVYESHTQIDPRQDTLRDPSRMVATDAPAPTRSVEDLDCMMYFELENDRVVDARYDGAGCKVIPRPGVSPRS